MPTLSQTGSVDIRPAYNTLFKCLSAKGVKFSSWKSNEHLLKGLCGNTDVDLLFRSEDRAFVTKLMAENGFILYKAPPHRLYPGLVDYIFLEAETGKVLHAHAHFLVCLGAKNVKNHILPWLTHSLNHTTRSEHIPELPISSHKLELLYLFMRYALKVRWRDLFRVKVLRKSYMDKPFFKEFSWLQERVTGEELYSESATLLGEAVGRLCSILYNDPHDFRTLLLLRYQLKSKSGKESWNRFSYFTATLLAWKNELLNFVSRVCDNLHIQQSFFKRRRGFDGAGVIFAFVGADGSGKSTVVTRLLKSLETKIDVQYFYLGTGDGRHSLSFFLTKKLLWLLSAVKNRGRNRSKTENSAASASAGSTIGFSQMVLAAMGARQKYKFIRKIEMLKKRGYIVICDRWPQDQIHGFNDGPILASLTSATGVKSWLAKIESFYYARMVDLVKPDMFLKLIAPIETVLERKPENVSHRHLIEKKIAGIKALKFDSPSCSVTIDASQSFEQVITDVRQEMFGFIAEHRNKEDGMLLSFLV